MRISTTLFFAFAISVSFSQQSTPSLEIISSANNEKVLFRGMSNLVEIKTAKGDSTDYYILGSNCYVTRINASGEKLPHNQYIIKPGKKDYSNINIAKTEKGVSKMLARETFKVKNIPDPIIYLDTYEDGDAISRDVELIQVRCPKESGINVKFEITDWTMVINGKNYSGNNHVISGEITELLQNVESGTTIEMTITSKGGDGVGIKNAAKFTVR